MQRNWRDLDLKNNVNVGSADGVVFSFREIPKVELHAHLSGSLSDEITAKLLKQRQESFSEERIPDLQLTLKLGNKRPQAECFEVFRAIHLLTNNIQAVKMITYDVIKEFSEDKVWYLELRTTPKSLQGVYTKQQYLEAVLESMREAEESMKILVRLLVSIDRAKGIDDGWDTLNLMKEYSRHKIYGKYICGIDVSGNPNANSLIEYLPILREAKKSSLKLAIHLLEVNTATAFEEAHEVINQGLVDRIGHAIFLHPLSGGSQTLTNIVKEKKIPIEICISSNLKDDSVPSLEKHHVKLWKEENHPIAVCTDDKGVFSTTLSEEIGLYNQAIGGDLEDVQSMILTSLESSFLEKKEKDDLLREMRSYMNKVCS